MEIIFSRDSSILTAHRLTEGVPKNFPFLVLTFGLISPCERGDANMAALLYFENIIYQVHFSRPIWNLKPSFITIWSQDYTIALEPNAFKSYFFVKSKLKCNAWLCLVEFLPGRVVREINKPQYWNKVLTDTDFNIYGNLWGPILVIFETKKLIKKS